MDKTHHALISTEPAKNSMSSSINSPGNRLNHLITVYNSKVYILGGTSANSIPLEDHYQNVYSYNFDNMSWTKKVYFEREMREEQVLTRSFMASCQIDNKLYIFGGSSIHKQCNNQLLCLDMDTLQWISIKDENPPAPRQSAKMVPFKDNILLLYGGVDFHSLHIFSSIHLYNTETRKWVQCKGDYQHIIRPRFDSSICVFQNTLHLFGGEYRTPKNNEYYLNDFYKLDILENNDDWIAEAQLIRPLGKVPEPRSAHFMFSYKDEYLLILGGDNVGQENMITIWVYESKLNEWKKFEFNNPIPKSFGIACCCDPASGKIYLHGGMNTHDSVKLDLYSISINQEIKKYFPEKPKPVCKLCQYPFKNRTLKKEDAESYSEMIDFPYAAFGLLLENCDSFHSDEFTLKYRETEQGPVLEIKQTNDLHYTFSQMRDSIMNYQGSLHFNPMGPIQKKVRLSINKQNSLRQYGLFLKASALRLGDEFIYFMFRTNQIWIFAYILSDEQIYTFYSFSWDTSQQKILKGCESDKEAIYANYEDEVEKILTKKPNKNKEHSQKQNILLIFKLKQIQLEDGQKQPFIGPFENKQDIIINNYKHFTYFQDPQILLQSIDISLRSYLSVFFLKNQRINIRLQVCQRWVQILPQMYLQSYDQMVRSRSVFEIQNSMVNLDLRILELYFNPNLKGQTSTFHNGVLIYHKNKLIERYGCPLGHIIRMKNSDNWNCFNIFGLLEVPETVQTSIFRTDFAYNVMMEKLRSKLRYFETHLERNKEKVISLKRNSKALNSMESMRSEDNDSFSKDKSKKKQKKKERKSQKNLIDPKSEVPSRSNFLESENIEAEASKKVQSNAEIVQSGRDKSKSQQGHEDEGNDKSSMQDHAIEEEPNIEQQINSQIQIDEQRQIQQQREQEAQERQEEQGQDNEEEQKNKEERDA